MNKSVFVKLLALLWVLGLTIACDRLPDSLISQSGKNQIAMAIGQIAETGQLGQFTLSGTANLPEQTLLTISAVRRITPQVNSSHSDEESRHAILDRKSAIVREGRWQAQLSLWEASPQGYYQESWQQGNSNEAVQPSSTVEFWATLEPTDLSRSELKDRLEVIDSTQNPLLNFTPDGEPYLKVSESKVVALPNATAVTAAITPEADRPGWQGRSTLASPDNRLTEQPQLLFDSRDNLPLPEENRLR